MLSVRVCFSLSLLLMPLCYYGATKWLESHIPAVDCHVGSIRKLRPQHSGVQNLSKWADRRLSPDLEPVDWQKSGIRNPGAEGCQTFHEAVAPLD